MAQQPPGGPSGPDFGDMGKKLTAARGPDRLILIAGIVFLVDSFLPWYGADFGPFSVNVKGWSAGGLAVLSILFALAALIWAAVNVLGVKTNVDTKTAGTIYLILGGGAFVFALLKLVVDNDLMKYGLFIAIVLGAILGYGGYLKYKAVNP